MPENVPTDRPVIKTPVKARAGITGVGVRYVLAFGLVGIIVAFILVAMWFYR